MLWFKYLTTSDLLNYIMWLLTSANRINILAFSFFLSFLFRMIDISTTILRYILYNYVIRILVKNWVLLIDSYPPKKYPVLAFRGAPASYPALVEHQVFQQYLQFSDRVTAEASKYLKEHFEGQPYVGIHLRNGPDWVGLVIRSLGSALSSTS